VTDISRLGLPLQLGPTIAMNRKSITDATVLHRSQDHRLRVATANKVENKTASLLILTKLVDRDTFTFSHNFRENIYKTRHIYMFQFNKRFYII